MSHRLEPPHSEIEPVTDIMHGVAISDPYRWLENQSSAETRKWLAAQTDYARSYFEAIADRDQIHKNVRTLLDVEACDCLQKVGGRYFFRKRLPGQQQFCIYFREGFAGQDQLLLDPASLEAGDHTAVRPLQVSADGRLLLYEVKQGGERTASFGILDVESRQRLTDALPRGYLRGFIFAPDSQGFYYVHESAVTVRPHYRAAYLHLLSTTRNEDQEVFVAGEDEYLRLHLIPGDGRIGFLAYRFLDQTYMDFYLCALGSGFPSRPLVRDAVYKLGPILLPDGRILAITDRAAPNLRIVELRAGADGQLDFIDIIPPCEHPIRSWIVTKNRIFVSYIQGTRTQVSVFDGSGKYLDALPIEPHESARLIGISSEGDELFIEQESFTTPIRTVCYSPQTGHVKLWAERQTTLKAADYHSEQVWYTAKDGTRVPMFLVGRREVFQPGPHPTIMTSYGGYGTPMTPQFSVLAAFLMERGCLFALPNIRGGSEFGVAWHLAARRQNKQVAVDDFLSAALWLTESGRTAPTRLGIFGGSHAGLLVAAAMTQRPDLFRAALCMAPMLDLLRYHLFDGAHIWKEEFGTADDADDFAALSKYSPYHRVSEGVSYPATLIVSGDLDNNCNSLHARKMVARLQAATTSKHPIILDYSPFRGHSPVLPLSDRVDGLTNRLAFLCDQLQLPV